VSWSLSGFGVERKYTECHYSKCATKVSDYIFQNYCRRGIKENILPEKFAQDLLKISEIHRDAYFMTHNSHSRSFFHATLLLNVTAVEFGEQNNHMNDTNTYLTREYMLVWNSV